MEDGLGGGDDIISFTCPRLFWIMGLDIRLNLIGLGEYRIRGVLFLGSGQGTKMDGLWDHLHLQ